MTKERKVQMHHRALSSLSALIGLALIVGVSVFPDNVNLWISLGAAIALTATASTFAAYAYTHGLFVTGSVQLLTTGLGAFLIIATLIFDGVSRGWLVVIAGGVVELVALATSPNRRSEAAVARLPEASARAA
jgi:hypothetical protein